jgi:hypothetical protein
MIGTKVTTGTDVTTGTNIATSTEVATGTEAATGVGTDIPIGMVIRTTAIKTTVTRRYSRVNTQAGAMSLVSPGSSRLQGGRKAGSSQEDG